MLTVGTLRLLRLFGWFSIPLICGLALVSGLGLVLFWGLRFVLLARGVGIIALCFGALFLRRLGIILLVLCVKSARYLREGKAEGTS